MRSDRSSTLSLSVHEVKGMIQVYSVSSGRSRGITLKLVPHARMDVYMYGCSPAYAGAAAAAAAGCAWGGEAAGGEEFHRRAPICR